MLKFIFKITRHHKEHMVSQHMQVILIEVHWSWNAILCHLTWVQFYLAKNVRVLADFITICRKVLSSNVVFAHSMIHHASFNHFPFLLVKSLNFVKAIITCNTERFRLYFSVILDKVTVRVFKRFSIWTFDQVRCPLPQIFILWVTCCDIKTKSVHTLHSEDWPKVTIDTWVIFLILFEINYKLYSQVFRFSNYFEYFPAVSAHSEIYEFIQVYAVDKHSIFLAALRCFIYPVYNRVLFLEEWGVWITRASIRTAAINFQY
jgi:hypothetical protein